MMEDDVHENDKESKILFGCHTYFSTWLEKIVYDEKSSVCKDG